jgi:hypothetical protein
MKYTTTDKHPLLLMDIEVIESQMPESKPFWYNGKEIIVSQILFEKWLKDDSIKEVEEKEFTKSDMIEFAKNIDKYMNQGHSVDSAIDLFKSKNK